MVAVAVLVRARGFLHGGRGRAGEQLPHEADVNVPVVRQERAKDHAVDLIASGCFAVLAAVLTRTAWLRKLTLSMLPGR